MKLTEEEAKQAAAQREELIKIAKATIAKTDKMIKSTGGAKPKNDA